MFFTTWHKQIFVFVFDKTWPGLKYDQLQEDSMPVKSNRTDIYQMYVKGLKHDHFCPESKESHLTFEIKCH